MYKQKETKGYREIGVPLGNNTLYTLSFADNQIVMAHDFDDIDAEEAQRKHRKWGLKSNV